MNVSVNPELIEAADLADWEPSVSVSRLLALELFRERRVSAGRAAELAGAPLEEFLDFAASREVPLNYSLADLEEDREVLDRLKR